MYCYSCKYAYIKRECYGCDDSISYFDSFDGIDIECENFEPKEFLEKINRFKQKEVE